MSEKKHQCPPHHFIIDADNIGRCIYCGEVKDFGKLQRKDKLLQEEVGRGGVASIGKPRKPYDNKGRPPKHG